MPIVMMAALPPGRVGLAAFVEAGALLEGLWQMN
jgi:hypothetical protein